jgi:nucleoside-diphosphate-sugar epimerase
LKILVTGARGTVGSHLVKRLAQQGHQAVGLERFNLPDDDCEFKCDIIYPEEVDRAFEKVEPDLTIHLAAEVGRLNCELFPERTLRANVLGTLNVVNACMASGSKLINFSTSEVYGEAFDYKLPVIETELLEAFGCSNVYAISKLTGEAIIRHYSKNYGLRAITVRPIMLYGEGERPNRYRSAFTNFVWAALNGRSMTVHKGTGRAWCHYDDFVDALSLLLPQVMEDYEAFNIGSDEYVMTEDLARMICRETGASESLIDLVEPPERFLSRIKRASIAKIRALGYEPKVSLEQGVRRVVKWQRETLLKTSR